MPYVLNPVCLPQSVLHQGGLLAVLSFLDFFQTSVQRIAVATAANMCRGLTADSLEAVTAAVPILTNLLQYEVHRPLSCDLCLPHESTCRPGVRP